MAWPASWPGNHGEYDGIRLIAPARRVYHPTYVEHDHHFFLLLMEGIRNLRQQRFFRFAEIEIVFGVSIDKLTGITAKADDRHINRFGESVDGLRRGQ